MKMKFIFHPFSSIVEIIIGVITVSCTRVCTIERSLLPMLFSVPCEQAESFSLEVRFEVSFWVARDPRNGFSSLLDSTLIVESVTGATGLLLLSGILILPFCSSKSIAVSPFQKRIGFMSDHICWYPQCLLRISDGLSDPGICLKTIVLDAIASRTRW